MINGTREHRIIHVHGFTVRQLDRMRAYLQGHVYDWCLQNHGEPFMAMNMIGNINRDWNGTPLQDLYDFYLRRGRGHDYAHAQAARAAGWLLWQVLVEDNRNFRTQPTDTRHYRRSYLWDD